MIELCNILIQFFYDRGWLFQMPPNPQSKQFFFSEFSVKDEYIVELSEEGMCDRLWLVISQIEVVTVFTVTVYSLQVKQE